MHEISAKEGSFPWSVWVMALNEVWADRTAMTDNQTNRGWERGKDSLKLKKYHVESLKFWSEKKPDFANAVFMMIKRSKS